MSDRRSCLAERAAAHEGIGHDRHVCRKLYDHGGRHMCWCGMRWNRLGGRR